MGPQTHLLLLWIWMWQLTMFHIVAAIDTYSKSASWIPARSHIWSNFVIGSLVSCSISHLIIAGMVPALSATSHNPSSESVPGQSYVVMCLCNIDIENWYRHRMADVTNPKTSLGFLGMVDHHKFLKKVTREEEEVEKIPAQLLSFTICHMIKLLCQ